MEEGPIAYCKTCRKYLYTKVEMWEHFGHLIVDMDEMEVSEE